MVDVKAYYYPNISGAMHEFNYQYDRVGNIKSYEYDSFMELNGEGVVTYFYDEQNQLIMECNGLSGETYVYTYDTYGNIREKKTYSGINFDSTAQAFEYGTLLNTDTYEYTDHEWRDILTAYNDSPFLYDIIGNPLTYNNGSAYTFTWQNGRQLATTTVNSTNISYEYNIDGLRTKKTVQNGNTYYYYYSGDKLISMTWDNGAKSLNFLYNGAAPYSVVYYDGTYSTSYYYITNLQGDVVAIMNAQHGIVAEYVYDAWGNILAITNSSGVDISGNAAHIANLNPIRYRGYFYDTETGFYYLQSRYYDPVVGRFINLDGFVTTDQGFLSYNMYAYCGNNPVMFVDPSGLFFGSIKKIVDTITEIVVNTIKSILTVNYEVPLFSQGEDPICWAYCQVMVEAYYNDSSISQSEATEKAHDLAFRELGSNWAVGNWPTNCLSYDIEGTPIFIDDINNNFELLTCLKNNGPIYGYYNSIQDKTAHLVVVTGCDIINDIVYTNNPWGIKGQQSFADFSNGFAGGPNDGSFNLWGCIAIQWEV